MIPQPGTRRTATPEDLFQRDAALGRTGMLTRWVDLTPRQRAGYRAAARFDGRTYSIAADAVVPAAGDEVRDSA